MFYQKKIQNITFYQEENLFNKSVLWNLPNLEGINCNTGFDYYFISSNFNLYRCLTHFVYDKDPLDNLFTSNILPEVKQSCSYPFCLCSCEGINYGKHNLKLLKEMQK